MLFDFDGDLLLLPTAPDEVFRLRVNEELAIALVNRPLVLAAITRPATEAVATALADFSASWRLTLPHAGGVLIDLYLTAGIASIVI